MLKVFLEDCFDSPQEVDVNKYLEKVLGICQEEDVRKNLQSYSDNHNKPEKQLYDSFVLLTNAALGRLQNLPIPGAHPVNDIEFRVQDPKLIKQTHRGVTSWRKADVVLVSKEAGRLSTGSTNPNTASTAATTEKPITWRDIRTFVEFKSNKRKMAELPDRYQVAEYEPPKHEYLTIDSKDQETVYVHSGSTAVLSSGPSTQHPPDGPVHAGGSQSEQVNSNTRKRASEMLQVPETQVKRRKGDRRDPVIVQAGYYVVEMFASHASRQHVVGLIVISDLLYVWRYDRRGAIQCSALNFIKDLPRFLVLLYAMQRFKSHHWGLNPVIDPEFGPQPNSCRMNLAADGNYTILTLNLSSNGGALHFGLNGRATNVFPTQDGRVAKLSWVEMSRQREHAILNQAHAIKILPDEVDDITGHIPTAILYHEFPGTSTASIRERLGIETDIAPRVLYLIVFDKLRPITELSGDEFFNAWWATVKCHRALWKHGVYHRDISPTNLMYYRDGEQKVVGVLNDFDLASTSNNPTRNERTGTIPFMALDLLTEQGLGGNVKYQYQHDAESFIWVLVWISLRYSDGKKVGKGENGKRPLDDWVKNRDTCRKDKRDFLGQRRLHMKLSGDHALNFRIANACLRILHIHLASRGDDESDRVLPDEKAYQELLCNPIAKLKPNLA